MLDQENQSKMAVEPATNNSVNNNNSTIIDSNNKLSNSDCTFYNNLLNDHDYCSPNKNSSPRQSEPASIIKTQQPQTNDKSLEGVGHKSKSSTTNAPECHASTSSSPSEYKDGSKSDAKMHEKMTTNDDDDAMSDDSISSSSIVSDDSIMDLIIPPDGNERKARSLAPKDTPSVSKPKLGRRPVLKTDFEIGKLKSNQKQKQKQPRPKRPRQNTSVTDKSQWITGEEQIESALSEHLNDNDKKEKRQRKEVHDPLFSHFTSSEYSSSDAESDKDSECGSEGDPDKLWCICNQPDDGKFMICCDICEYWFHGGCVGMTDSLLKSRQAHSKEWFCPDCDHAIQSGTPRNAIPLKIVKKEKKKSSSKTTGKRRGRPRKSTTPTREISTRLSLRSAKKMDESLESRSSAGRGPTKSRARSESYEKFENPERLKELIRERKKEFFLKHRLSEQHKAEKIRELGIGRKSLTASLGNSLDSLATSTNSPNMNNLPINIKSEHQDRKKPNIVLHINTKKDRGSLPGSGQRIVTIVNKRRHSESKDPSADESLATDPILNNKKIKREVDEEKSSTGLSETPPAYSTEKNIDVKVDARKETSSTSINKSPDPSLIQNNKEIENGVNIPTTTKSPINASEENSTQVDKTIKIETALEQNTTKPNSPSPTENTSPTSNNNKDRAEKVKPCVSSNEPCWSGTIVMPDVGKFTAIAKPVSGNSDFMQNDINQNLIICGRIAPEQVNSYIKKLKSTTKNQIVLVQLYPSTENDKPSFDTLFDYLYTRNRCGVINNSAPSQILKDFYILPVHEKSSIPEILKPIDGPGLDRKAPNCLVGILVKTKRPPSASSSASSYTPTPIS